MNCSFWFEFIKQGLTEKNESFMNFVYTNLLLFLMRKTNFFILMPLDWIDAVLKFHFERQMSFQIIGKIKIIKVISNRNLFLTQS